VTKTLAPLDTTANLDTGLPDAPLKTLDDALQLLLRVIEIQRECVSLASPDKKSIELKRLVGSIKVYHQLLITAQNMPKPEPEAAASRGIVSQMLAQIFERPPRKTRALGSRRTG
jgi:hypothetical protein